MTNLVLICVAFFIGINVEGFEIEDKVARYFQSELQQNFHDEWKKQKKPFQNAIQLTLQGLVGKKNLNLYMSRAKPTAMGIAKGFFLSDDIVSLLLGKLSLRDLPHMIASDVTFALSHHALRIEGPITKMFIDANYFLFRNKSAVLDSGVQDPYMDSPFTFQQVQTMGELAIVAEGCSIVGTTIATLIGTSVNLGHSSLRLNNCKFSIEIYNLGKGMPPVIAPYFSKQQSLQLEALLLRKVVADILPKMQATMFSTVNTTAIFGKNLMKYRHEQDKIFKVTANFMSRVVRALNKLTVQANQGTLKIDDLVLQWDDTHFAPGSKTTVAMKNIMLSGLDTAYCPQGGGPYLLTDINIAEKIRFSTLQVKGEITYENDTIKKTFDFGSEIRDVTVLLKIHVDMVMNEKKTLKPSKDVRSFEVVGWRASSFSIHDFGMKYLNVRIKAHVLVQGYLTNEVPKLIMRHVSNLLSEALSNPDAGKSEFNNNNKEPYVEGEIFSKEKQLQNGDYDNEAGDDGGKQTGDDDYAIIRKDSIDIEMPADGMNKEPKTMNLKYDQKFSLNEKKD